MPPVTKSSFLGALECPRKGWYVHHAGAAAPPSEADLFRQEQGREIGQRARDVWGPGESLAGHSFGTATTRTRSLLGQSEVHILFEPAFQWNELGTRVDILERTAGGWEILEVKSSLDPKQELVDDLAYTYLVVTRSGLPVTRATLVLVSREYRLGQPPAALFREEDITAEVVARAAEFEGEAPRLIADIQRRTEPSATLRWACKDCEHFSIRCLGMGLQHPLFELPGLREPKFQALVAQGCTQVGDIVDPSALSDRQRQAWQAVTTGCRIVNPAALDRLDEVTWPARYLDFETVTTALPLLDEVAPYEQVPTQYSLHTCTAPGVVAEHREYLADHSGYDRRELAERLLADLGTQGSIVCYTSFEKTVMTGLAARFPDLAPRLQQCIDRLFDLEAVFRGGAVADPAFGGRTSIKKTLPALVPELGYDDLVVQNGGDASTCFARLLLGQFPPAEANRKRQALLAYCERDTLAMVRLHEVLAHLRSPGGRAAPSSAATSNSSSNPVRHEPGARRRR